MKGWMRPLRRFVLKASEAFRAAYSVILGRPSNFSRFIDNVYASGLPYGKRASAWLKKVGITAVVTLTENAPKLDGLIIVHVPMENGKPAEPWQLEKAISAIDGLLKDGHKVLVHCSAGKDRTGMVLAAYIISKNGVGPEEAISFVRSIRKGSITGPEQVESIKRFWEKRALGKG